MQQSKVLTFLLLILASVTLQLACSSTSSTGGGGDMGSADDFAGLEAEEVSTGGGPAGLSANNAVLTYSVSNNPLTTKQIDPRRAASVASRIARSISKDSADNTREITNLISLRKFAGASLDEVYSIAKQLAVSEMQKDIRRQLPEQAKFELALAAFQNRRISMAEYWLDQISDTKNKRLKAAELTTRGMIAKTDNRLPEAVDFWNQALRQFPNYEPARLNIGFIALLYGDYTTAKKMLGNMQHDFFATVGLMQAERLSNNVNRVESLCNRIKSQSPNYKPALFSCALNTYQGQGNLAKARQELEAAARADGGLPGLDEKIFMVIGRVDNDLRQAQAKAAAPQQSQPQQSPQGQAPAQNQ